ncbi:SDR family oxidoreductase [Nocardioides sp. zg-1308]|uniref:dTDP-4-dehydrorhamnose reductase family protein n=1 Tax=Nocardioides sp. zg-1308 TaxID=2736253 RepID=UPI001C131CF1
MPDAHPAMSVLVLGATGMLGHALMHELGSRPDLDVHGTVRSLEGVPATFAETFGDRLTSGVDVRDRSSVHEILSSRRPDVVVNAIGVIKQVPTVADTALTAEINGLLPHVLAQACTESSSRLIHLSTDCVFSGRRGAYDESDVPDPIDFYGRSKLLGEVVAEPHLTLRTSIIGPELTGKASLVEWFLAQRGTTVRGFRKAIYSGLPTVEMATLIGDLIVSHPDLTGLWHVASDPIDKDALLRLVAEAYDWAGDIVADDAFVIDRSLRADRLREEIGYAPPDWPRLVRDMHAAHVRWNELEPVR